MVKLAACSYPLDLLRSVNRLNAARDRMFQVWLGLTTFKGSLAREVELRGVNVDVFNAVLAHQDLRLKYGVLEDYPTFLRGSP